MEVISDQKSTKEMKSTPKMRSSANRKGFSLARSVTVSVSHSFTLSLSLSPFLVPIYYTDSSLYSYSISTLAGSTASIAIAVA